MNSEPQDLEALYGPQSESDHPFRRKARLLQSYYRTKVLKEPFGVGPNRTSDSPYGNMLREGTSTGMNFLDRDIFNYAQEKVSKKKDIKELTIDEFRLFNNMLSSMPMCFNLFYPFMQALETNSASSHETFHAIFSWLPIEKVTFIDIEYIPLPIKDYINDKTAFDAVILFENEDKQQGIIAIETKYTDKLGTNVGKKNQKKIEIAEAAGIFTEDALKDIREYGCQQLMRNVLLTESYRLKHQMTYSQSIILSPADEPFSDQEVAEFQTLLLPSFQTKIARVTIEDFISAPQSVLNPGLRKHLHAFHNRFLDFQKVEALL